MMERSPYNPDEVFQVTIDGVPECAVWVEDNAVRDEVISRLGEEEALHPDLSRQQWTDLQDEYEGAFRILDYGQTVDDLMGDGQTEG